MLDILSDVMRASGLYGGQRQALELEPGQSYGLEADPLRSPFYILSRGSAVAELTHPNPATPTTDTTSVELQPSDLVFFPGGHAHRLVVPSSAAAPARILTNEFRFRSPLVDGFFAALEPLIHLRADDPGYAQTIAPLTAMSCTEAGQNLPGAQATDRALLELYFVQILRVHTARIEKRGGHCPRHPFAISFDTQFVPLLQRVHEKLHLGWTVESMAKEVNMSRAAFAAKFSQVAGRSPGSYLTHLRMERAATMLSESRASIEQITATVGYSSESAFSLAFKRHYGLPPGLWRKFMYGHDGETARRISIHSRSWFKISPENEILFADHDEDDTDDNTEDSEASASPIAGAIADAGISEGA